MVVQQFCNVDEIQILLNTLGDNLKVTYPLYNFDLFHIKQNGHNYKLDIKCRKEDFEKATNDFKDFSYEMPNFWDFIQVMLASGVIQYKNMNDFIEEFNQFRKWTRSKRIIFSADTNIFYGRFFSNFGKIEPKEIILVDGIKEEIKSAQNQKYQPFEITEIKKNAKLNTHLIDELFNRKKKKTRLASYIAQREYNSISDGVLSIVPSLEKLSSDKENNDKIIVSSLCKSEESKHNLIYFLTADDNISDLCKLEQLECFLFEQPKSLSVDRCSSQQLRELIYNLARVFGFIQVGSVMIFGEYKEQSSNRPDYVMFEFLNEKIFHDFKHDLIICRRLVELKIND